MIIAFAGAALVRTALVALIIIVGLAVASSGKAFAQEPAEPSEPVRPGSIEPRYEFYLDPYLGEDSGARDVSSIVTIFGSGEERIDAPLSRSIPVGATALRLGRTAAWDVPVAWWFGVVLHETFGHGGRAREFDASPGVHLGSPWEGRVSFASFDGRGKSTEELLYIYIGGTEGNDLAATYLERRVVEGVRMRPLELFFLASNRLVASRYVLRTTPDPQTDPGRFFSEFSGGGDLANYLGLLHELHGAGTGITASGVDDSVLRQWRRLRRQAWWNALDPGAWWAIASALRIEARGDGSPALPLPDAGRFRFLPLFSSEWTPSGGETSLELAMAPDTPAVARSDPARRDSTGRDRARHFPPWFSFVARRGRGPSGSFGALGAAADDLSRAGRFSLGGMAEIWHDPRNGLGGGARLRARLLNGYLRDVYFDLGVKSQGYWIGQPATAGVYAAVGLRIEP
ncbi:MAG TPA: hypothetical protein VJ144_10445 [Candidatus Polarisedimenticolia bacterium]|nr:hypothetical protein [Candidatus Polarisedimenticolia bacterium]